MKIVTWNINSIRLRLPLLKLLIDNHQPDIICLQETKVQDSEFPIMDIMLLGYENVVFTGQKSYNGVAILSKYPITEHFSLEFYNSDKRHIAAKISDIEVHNFYVPAGGDEPDEAMNPKFKHKIAYLTMMNQWFLEERKNNKNPIILVGDLNIAPLEHDVWSSKSLKNTVSHTKIEREMLLNNINSFGFIDSARHLIPSNEKVYSWWSYRSPDWSNSDRGRRLDHIWITEHLIHCINKIEHLRQFRAYEQPSDHVPVMLYF